MDYPLNVYTTTYTEDFVQEIQEITDLAENKQWSELLTKLKQNSFHVNICRLPTPDSGPPRLCTPLHLAALGNAPVNVFEELLDLGASRTLKNADGDTAFAIARRMGLSEEIQELLKLPEDVLQNESDIVKMENGLHSVILGRVEDLIQENGMQLPQLAFLFEFGSFDYPVPGMYGGFGIEKHDKGVQVESWCRIAGGSGQRHIIDRDGNVELVDEGFV